jgi:uncharacterized protein
MARNGAARSARLCWALTYSARPAGVSDRIRSRPDHRGRPGCPVHGHRPPAPGSPSPGPTRPGVALVARTKAAIAALADELGGTAHPADLSDPTQVGDLVGHVEEEAGPIDVLVNNAGVGTPAAFTDAPDDDLRIVTQVNYLAPAELCRQIIPRMLERGGGHIVNVSSMAGCSALPGLVELGPIPTEMLAHTDDYEPTAAAFRQFYRMRVIADVPRETVADEVVEAVQKGRKHVRMPKRMALQSILAEAPRRITEVMITGIPPRVD